MGKDDWDLKIEEIEKCRKKTVVMEEEDCIIQNFKYLKKCKSEPNGLKLSLYQWVAKASITVKLKMASLILEKGIKENCSVDNFIAVWVT